MSGANYSVNVSELEGLSRRFDTVASFANDNYPLFFGLAEIMKRQTADRFESESDPGGKAWPAFAASTLNRREKRGSRRRAALGSQSKPGGTHGDKMLRDSGELFASIMARLPIISDNTVEVGTNKVYSRIHNLGGQAGRNHKVTIPQRQYMGFSDVNKHELVTHTQRYYSAAIHRGLGA